MNDKGSNNPDPEGPQKRTILSNYRMIMFTYDVKNPKYADTSRNILLTCLLWTISGKTERMLQGNKSNRWPTSYISVCPQWD